MSKTGHSPFPNLLHLQPSPSKLMVSPCFCLIPHQKKFLDSFLIPPFLLHIQESGNPVDSSFKTSKIQLLLTTSITIILASVTIITHLDYDNIPLLISSFQPLLLLCSQQRKLSNPLKIKM